MTHTRRTVWKDEPGEECAQAAEAWRWPRRRQRRRALPRGDQLGSSLPTASLSLPETYSTGIQTSRSCPKSTAPTSAELLPRRGPQTLPWSSSPPLQDPFQTRARTPAQTGTLPNEIRNQLSDCRWTSVSVSTLRSSTCGQTPSTASTTMMQPSQMRTAMDTSEEKSTCPGESIRLTRYSSLPEIKVESRHFQCIGGNTLHHKF